MAKLGDFTLTLVLYIGLMCEFFQIERIEHIKMIDEKKRGRNVLAGSCGQNEEVYLEKCQKL